MRHRHELLIAPFYLIRPQKSAEYPIRRANRGQVLRLITHQPILGVGESITESSSRHISLSNLGFLSAAITRWKVFKTSGRYNINQDGEE